MAILIILGVIWHRAKILNVSSLFSGVHISNATNYARVTTHQLTKTVFLKKLNIEKLYFPDANAMSLHLIPIIPKRQVL